jgi:hypothetical protein
VFISFVNFCCFYVYFFILVYPLGALITHSCQFIYIAIHEHKINYWSLKPVNLVCEVS